MPVGFYELPDRDLEVRVEEKTLGTPGHARQLGKTILDACQIAEKTSQRVTVNLEAVEFLGSAALSELLRIARYTAEKSIRYRLVKIRPEILEVFTYTKLDLGQ